MPQHEVHMPDGSVSYFPDTMGPDDISAAIERTPAYKGPDTYWGGFLSSAGDTAKKAAQGFAEGFNPLTALGSLLGTVSHPIQTVEDVGSGLYNFLQHPIANTVSGVQAVSDPETGGRAIGNLALALVTGRLGKAGVAQAPSRATVADTLEQVAKSPSSAYKIPLNMAAKIIRGEESMPPGVSTYEGPRPVLSREVPGFSYQEPPPTVETPPLWEPSSSPVVQGIQRADAMMAEAQRRAQPAVKAAEESWIISPQEAQMRANRNLAYQALKRERTPAASYQGTIYAGPEYAK